MNLDHLPEVAATRLLWREQIVAVRRSLWFSLRRMLRREPRQYLTMDGKVVARFTCVQDAAEFMTWVADTHEATLSFGVECGREAVVEQIRKGLSRVQSLGTPDAGDPGPA